MKNGIPCNETRFTNGKDRNRIVYQFVADDGVTPSTCTIRIGDKDPLTGEPAGLTMTVLSLEVGLMAVDAEGRPAACRDVTAVLRER